MRDLPQLFDAAPGMYEALEKMAERGHSGTCITEVREGADMTDCDCGYREALKSIAYARGDEPLDVDDGTYQL